MLGHVVAGLEAFAADPVKLGAFLISLWLAAALYFAVGVEKNLARKTLLMKLNFFVAAFPFSLLALSLGCSVAQLGCAVVLTQVLLLAVPLALVVALVLIRILMPRLQCAGCRSLHKSHALSRFAVREAKLLGLPLAPKVFLLERQAPVAYCVEDGSVIVVSVGVLELLSRREQEAVVLHELHHLASNGPSFKALSAVYRFFLPFSSRSFSKDIDLVEIRADDYAASRQGTRRFLNSARGKFSS